MKLLQPARPAGIEKELITRYSTQILSKEVSVTVVSAPFAVFISGAVIRPGKVISDHPISALEAIMEAGGFDMAKANTSAVMVIRQVGDRSQNFTLNLKQVLDGRQTTPFFLHRSDVVHVPEKFKLVLNSLEFLFIDPRGGPHVSDYLISALSVTRIYLPHYSQISCL